LKNALRDFDNALKIKSSESQYLFERAQILFDTKKYEKALIDYTLLIKKNKSDASFYKQKALIENELELFESAKNDIAIYLKFYPWDSEALFVAGKINLNDGDYFEALKYFNQSIEKDNSKPAYYEARGDAYFAVKTYEYAENSFSMALDLEPTGVIYYKKGLCRLALNNVEGACADWKKAVKLGYFPAEDYLKKYDTEN
jgi:tetratricopeptide (TPR) repeat protein